MWYKVIQVISSDFVQYLETEERQRFFMTTTVVPHCSFSPTRMPCVTWTSAWSRPGEFAKCTFCEVGHDSCCGAGWSRPSSRHTPGREPPTFSWRSTTRRNIEPNRTPWKWQLKTEASRSIAKLRLLRLTTRVWRWTKATKNARKAKNRLESGTLGRIEGCEVQRKPERKGIEFQLEKVLAIYPYPEFSSSLPFDSGWIQRGLSP